MGFLIDALGLKDVTRQDLLVWAAVLFLCVLLFYVGKIVFRKKESQILQKVTCPCGWVGQVSRYAGRCPMCNEPLGEQKASDWKR